MPALVKRRAAHIVGENERVFQAVEHLKGHDAVALGRLMRESHRSSMENFENSTPELDALVEISCSQEGVYGARLTGGGFGGAIVALVSLDAIEKSPRQSKPSISRERVTMEKPTNASLEMVPWCTSERIR